MRLMNKSSQAIPWKICCGLLDDILVYFKEEKEHLKHLEAVFTILRAQKLYAKMVKCEFLTRNVKF